MTGAPWNTLTGRMVLVITVALVLAQAIALVAMQLRADTILIDGVRGNQAAHAAQTIRRLRAAASADEDLADVDLDSSVIGVWRTPEPQAADAARPDPSLEAAVSRAAGLGPDASLRIWTLDANGWIASHLPADTTLDLGDGAFSLVHAAWEVRDGVWLNFLVQPRPRFWPPSQPIVTFLLFSLATLAIVSALVARRISAPFRALTAASQRLASGDRHEAVPVYGPVDVRRAQTAFNVMGARLQATLLSQQALLAAIGHDLRTPLTALRVRAELLADEGEKERISRALDELERLTDAALQAASHAAADEAAQPIDVTGLVYSVCDDLVDLGQPVAFAEPDQNPIVEGWPDALARALRNIVENAVRYGDRARVRLETMPTRCAIVVTDDGPGIPDADHARVFEPLVRLEGSRCKSTGGHGLGLHIARNTVLAHGGEVRLRNRAEGGLEVTIDLPLRT